MKKLVFFALILFILFMIFPQDSAGEEVLEEATEMIPDDSIRLRILANSDSEADQQLKNQVRDRVNEEINGWVEHTTSLKEARAQINEKLPIIEGMVAEVMDEEDASNDFTVEYDENTTFPVKLYGDHLYPPGEYEAILITIGEGDGANWWCVLFPPLCFLDFSDGTTVEAAGDDVELEDEEEETEVKFFLLRWLDWF